MIKEFTDRIAKGQTIAIFGAGFCGCGLKKYIEENRPDIKIKFFIDTFQKGEKDGLQIINTAELPEIKNQFDLLVVATTSKTLADLQIIFEFINIPFICVSREIEQHYRISANSNLLEKQKQATEIFKDEQDKKLYNLIWDAYYAGTQRRKAEDYVFTKYGISKYDAIRNYNYHYLEFINRNKIKTILDAGFCDGIHSLAFRKALPNLQKLYAFEPMYSKFRNELYDKFIQAENFVEIIPFGLYNTPCKIEFCINEQINGASRIAGTRGINGFRQNETLTSIETTTIDLYCKEHNIKKIDFIKMDIEGAETKALEGGIETIKRDRPQLAISIYHSISDFVNIPLYLHEELTNYTFHIGHYSPCTSETVLYAIPNELTEK